MNYLISVLLVLSLVGCNESQNKKIAATNKTHSDKIEIQSDGKALLQKHCYVCHNPNATAQNRMAPPMIAIKKHYLDTDTTEEEFLIAILSWVKKPTKESSRMPGAIRRFGLMPYQPFKDKDIRTIASYMYSNDIEQPE